jgi:hypothetical protein
MSERLDALAATIRQLRGELIEREREAFDVAGGETDLQRSVERAAAIRALLDEAHAAYFDLAEHTRLRPPLAALDERAPA